MAIRWNNRKVTANEYAKMQFIFSVSGEYHAYAGGQEDESQDWTEKERWEIHDAQRKQQERILKFLGADELEEKIDDRPISKTKRQKKIDDVMGGWDGKRRLR